MATRSASPASYPRHSRWTRLRNRTVARLGWLWVPRLYVGILTGYLLGRALPGAQIAPFGIAFYAAVRGAGFSGKQALPVALAVVAGAGGLLGWTQAAWIAAGLGACHVLATGFRLGRKSASPVGAAVVAGGVSVATAALSPANASLMQSLIWCGLTGILALIFTLGIADASSGRVFYRGSTDSPVPAVVVLAAALSGLDGVSLLGLMPMRDVAGSFLIMVCAFAGGAPLGAAAGAVLGVSLLFTAMGSQQTTLLLGYQPLTIAAVSQTHGLAFVLAGLAAGAFRDLHRLGVALAFCVGLATYAFALAFSTADLIGLAYSTLAATGLFWLLPRGWLEAVPATLITEGTTTKKVSESPSLPFARIVEQVRGLSRVLREINRTLDQVAAVGTTQEEVPGRIFEQVSEQVCQGCSMFRHCWEREFQGTYQLFSDLWSQAIEEGSLPVDPVSEALERLCIHSEQVTAALNYYYEARRTQQRWERRLEEGRSLTGDYVKNVARILDRWVEDLGPGTGKSPIESTPALRVASGVVRLPQPGSHISGDAYAGTTLGTDRYLMVLSDGMGAGRGAALESRQCVNLVQSLLSAGFTVEVAVQTVNSVFLLRSPEETFATVDIALLDLCTGRVEFVKIGAAPSFLKRGSDITVVKMASVPVGIIDQVQIEPEFRVVRPGDIIVMITDGVWDACKEGVDKEQWLVDHLGREASTDPEEIADGLLARARELQPEVGDDMTVFVARIDPVRGVLSGQAHRRAVPTPGWAVVRKAPRPGEQEASPKEK